MSSDVQVKDEPVLENEFNTETDSEAEDDIDLDKLQPLDPKFAALMKFPIGCKVWYDLCKSTKPKKCLQAKSAYVVEAYIHFENHKQVYKVKSETTEEEAIIYEDRLIYGANCPVTVTSHGTNEVRNGVIICPKLDQGKDNDRKQRISYAIQFWQGKKVSIEFGVAAESIKHRMEVKSTTDDSRKGGRIAAAKGNAGNESCETVEEARIDELTTNKAEADGIQSTEAHQLSGKTVGEEDVMEVEEEEEGEVFETNVHEKRKHENASVTEGNERPKKVARTTSNERECTCVLILPSWIKNRCRLWRHLVGAVARDIKSITTCSVWVSRQHEDETRSMTISIRNFSNSDVTHTSPISNVAMAVEMIERSILDHHDDRDTEKKMLYELAAKAQVSSNKYTLFPQEHGVVRRKYGGVNKWCRVIDLPRREDDPNKWSQDLKTLQWLQDLKALQRNNCTIELFDNISRTAPYCS